MLTKGVVFCASRGVINTPKKNLKRWKLNKIHLKSFYFTGCNYLYQSMILFDS